MRLRPYSHVSPHTVLSPIAVGLFILFFGFGLVSGCQAADTHELSRLRQPTYGPATPQKIGFSIGGGMKIPAGSGGEKWAPYLTAGSILNLPTHIRNLLFRFGADAGAINSLVPESIPAAYQRLYILQGSVSIAYDIYLISQDITLRPGVGLSQTWIQPAGGVTLRTIEPFNGSEKTFGALIGAEVIWRIRQLSISIPLQMNYAFSAPHRYVTLCPAIMLGGVF
jgi:hypothetical protein